MDRNLLTADELGDQLRVRPSTVRRWASDGLIPCLRISGRVVRFELQEVLVALRRLRDRADAHQVKTETIEPEPIQTIIPRALRALLGDAEE